MEPFRPQLKRSLQDTTFVVFDLESTGGNPHVNCITEICAIQIKNGEILGYFYSLVNPHMRIPPIVRKITGITDKMVRHAPSIQDILPEFLDFIGDHVLVSHNIIGDLVFIKYFAHKILKKQIDNLYLCTHLLAIKLLPEATKKSLSGLGEWLHLSGSANHRADGDAQQTYELLEHLIGKMPAKHHTTLESAIKLQGEFELNLRLGWSVPETAIKRLPAKPGVLIFYSDQDRVLFLTSANNLSVDAQKLSQCSTLPKPLARLLLQAHRIEHHLTLHLIEAMILEGHLLKQHTLLFPPYMWHQRMIYTLNIVPTPQAGQVQISLGPGKHGGITYGPVYDLQQCEAWLKRIAQICGVHIKKLNMPLPSDIGFWLVRHFSKNQRSVLKWLLKSLFAPSLISGMKRLLALWRNREALKQVIPTDASLLNDLKPLSELTGAFFIRHPFAKTVSVYEVVNSVIMYPAIAEHVDPELWVQSLKARPWLKALQVKATEIKRISPVLDSVDTPGMQAFIWVLFRQKHKHAYFWSMDDLRGYIKAPR